MVRHIDYIHYNPVKHGLINSPIAWPYSSFHRYAKQGDYDADWGAGNKIELWDTNKLDRYDRLRKMNQTPTVLDIQKNVGFRLQVESN